MDNALMDRVVEIYRFYRKIYVPAFSAKLAGIENLRQAKEKSEEKADDCLQKAKVFAQAMAKPYHEVSFPIETDSGTALLVALKQHVFSLEDALNEGDWTRAKDSWLNVSNLFRDVAPMVDLYRKLIEIYRPGVLENEPGLY